jgi:hypothetical protein
VNNSCLNLFHNHIKELRIQCIVNASSEFYGVAFDSPRYNPTNETVEKVFWYRYSFLFLSNFINGLHVAIPFYKLPYL